MNQPTFNIVTCIDFIPLITDILQFQYKNENKAIKEKTYFNIVNQ